MIEDNHLSFQLSLYNYLTINKIGLLNKYLVSMRRPTIYTEIKLWFNAKIVGESLLSHHTKSIKKIACI